MSRRLLTAGFVLAVLCGAPSGFGRVAAMPPARPIVENDVPSLRQLRPSVRRTMASCLLYGVHPLLALAPTEEYLDVDEDDEAPAPTKVIVVAPPATTDAPSPCPYMRQQQCAPDRQAVLFADPDFSRDVLQNLEALRQGRELLDKGRELGRTGHIMEALDALGMAASLCPGSRLDEEIHSAADQILANANDVERGKEPVATAGASEEQEAPVGLSSQGWLEIGVGLDGGFRMFTQFPGGNTVWHVECNANGWSYWTAPNGR